MVLLAGINPNIIVQKSGRVREKERTWEYAKKALLGNVNVSNVASLNQNSSHKSYKFPISFFKGFLDELKAFKMNIDEGTVSEVNFKDIRPFLMLEHFLPEVIEKRNSAAAGLCSWGSNIQLVLSPYFNLFFRIL